jgi:hypothetical protein
LFRKVLLEDPDNRLDDGAFMEFRLTYEGRLLATQRDPMNSQPMKAEQRENKHEIRRVIHHQLARLWDITPFLKTGAGTGPDVLLLNGGADPPDYSTATLAKKHALYGFNFIPLVSQELDLLCGLDILFLRPDRPGDVIWAGDIDNRLKTLFDALRIPVAGEDYVSRVAGTVENPNPMYCLLEEDKLITKVSVETDQLLDVQPSTAAHQTKLIITVRLRPFEPTLGNMQFG